MIIDDILEAFAETNSIKETAKRAGCGWQRVVKVLSSSGVVINDTHALILKMTGEGKTQEEIAGQTGYSLKTVQAYTPAKRPFYNVSLSDNAVRIKKCRERRRMGQASGTE